MLNNLTQSIIGWQVLQSLTKPFVAFVHSNLGVMLQFFMLSKQHANTSKHTYIASFSCFSPSVNSHLHSYGFFLSSCSFLFFFCQVQFFLFGCSLLVNSSTLLLLSYFASFCIFLCYEDATFLLYLSKLSSTFFLFITLHECAYSSLCNWWINFEC